MQEFPSNSNEVRKLRAVEPEEKVVTKIIKGGSIRRKPSLSKRFREMFFAEVDERQGIVDYVVGDIMVPALKDMIMDSFQQGMERTFYGTSRPRRNSSKTSTFGNTTRTPYDRYSSSNRDRPSPSRRSRSSHVVYDIILENRPDAESVIDDMRNILEKYEFVSCRDLYELVGETFHHTDEKFGWTNLRDAAVRRTSNGYLLDLPHPEAIDD